MTPHERAAAPHDGSGPSASQRPASGRPHRSGWARLLPGITPERRGLVLAWWGFTVTFGGMRLLTWLIHIDMAGVGDVQAGGVHLHHYVWGILLLALAGAVGLVHRSACTRAWTGLAYGVGLALIVDEAALLISLEDVYWDTEGGISIALALAVIAVAGSVLVFTRGRHGSRRKESAGRREPGRTFEG
ncbi:hypothetical protein [Streptomyces sp. NPDC058657]|uniref:hypothetical protein n=1 Tax=unclassified Streptomyces TaxID=2593676 RepID=UPI00365DC650